MLKFCLIFIFLIISLNNSNGEIVNSYIIPKPKIADYKEGNYTIKTATVKFIGSDTEKLNYCFNKLSSCLEPFNIFPKLSNNQNFEIKFEITNENYFSNIPKKFIQEAYNLNVSKNGISIIATAPKGIFYGVTSLIQLIERSENNIPLCNIIDYPDMELRGISDDISRGQVSKLDNFKKIIETIARYKMNTYMPYIEDVIELKNYPSIGINRGALTKTEIEELHKIAKENFVEIIPIFQTLGHYENILSQPEFLKYAPFPGAASLDVSNPDIYPFLENMLKEVFELFPSEYINIGADESYDVGLGSSKKLLSNNSLAEIHLQHYLKVFEICKKYNKKVMMYSDILLNHPEIIDKLPKDIIPVDWHYRPDYIYPSTITFASKGFNYIVSPSVWNFVTTFPINYLAFPNIKYITLAGINNSSMGMINSNWGDFGAETFKELVYLGYAYSAAISWNSNIENDNSFLINFFEDFFNAKDTGIAEVYQILGDQLNTIVWHDMWRHPALPMRTPAWYESNTSRLIKNENILASYPIIINLLNKAKLKAKRNLDHIKVLEFMANFTKYFALKTDTQEKLNNLLTNNQDRNLCLSLIDKNIAELNKLKSQYTEIWNTYYKSDNLNMIQDKFDYLIAYFKETKDAINNNSFSSTVIPSKWIYYSSNKDSAKTAVKFTKKLTLNGNISFAKMQLLADTHAKIYINGKFIDEVFARRSLSLLVDYKRVLYKDILSYLKDGDNIIEIEAYNYNREPNAGINFISKIIANNNTIQVISDESWDVCKIDDFNTTKKAEIKEYPFIVTSPNFETNRASKIER